MTVFNTSKPIEPRDPENKGVIADPRSPMDKSLDYIAGAETPIKYEILVPDGNWNPWLPIGKKQTLDNGTDTMGCTHFAVMQDIEMQLNRAFPSLPDTHKQFLLSHGFMDGDKVSLSSRFSAITGGNTVKGNYFHKVWETSRKMGVLPESDLPLGGSNWIEYHNPELITDDMLKKALNFLDFFEIKYDWVQGYDGVKGWSGEESLNTNTLLRQCPLNIGVPIPVNHAIVMTKFVGGEYDSFDHYTPFHRVNDKRGVGLAIRGVITVKKTTFISKPIYYFTKNMKFGDKNSDVKALQECLIYLGYLKPGLNTGYYGAITENAVKKYQESKPDLLKKAGIKKGTGLCFAITREFLNKEFQK